MVYSPLSTIVLQKLHSEISLSVRILLEMALRFLSRMVSESTSKSIVGLAGERSSMMLAPRNATRSSGRRLAVAAQQDAGAGHEESLDQERPKYRGNSLSRRGSGKQLQRTVDPLLELWNPLATSRSLIDILNSLDRVFEAPLFGTPVSALPSRMRVPHDLMEDDNAYRLRIDMPGLSKDEVQVYVENGQLVIKGEKKAEDKSDDAWARTYENYNSRITLPDEVKFDEVKAELKNGELRIVIPKSKDKPKEQVIPIQVQ